jgi:serine/threonine-protein kinase
MEEPGPNDEGIQRITEDYAPALAIRRPSAMTGRILVGRYALGREIGAGGMGVVFEARRVADGARVAVKLLLAVLPLRDDLRLARFHREAQATAAIDSKHVTRILETGADSDTGIPFIVMELLEGEDLERRLARTSMLTPDVAVRIAGQACEGLVAAHTAGVIHRDIKPANLFLVRGEGGAIHVKILDFGIAKTRPAPDAQTMSLTRSGAMVGSPLYMSPEQARGLKEIDIRTDLWSLGVVLHRALGGRAPHEGIEALGDLIMAICSRAAEPMRALSPWVPPEVAAIVDRALQIEPERRFQSADEMLNALRAVAPGGLAIDEAMLEPMPEARISAAALAHEIEARPNGNAVDSSAEGSAAPIKSPGTSRAPGRLGRALHAVGGRSHKVAVAGLLLAVALPSVVLGARSALALRVCATGDVEGCTKQCDRGNAESCHLLGMMYENGAELPRDESRAAAFYGAACARGHAVACHALGSLREEGKWSEADAPDAVRLYRLSCDGGSAQGCNGLGRMYNVGMGVPKDPARAAELFRKSCDGGYASGCSNLGITIEKGEGLPRDLGAARALYEKACDMGSASGCGNLGTMVLDGVVVPTDEARAAALFKKGCDGGYGLACTGLGLLHAEGKGVEKDDARAVMLYKRGCDGRDPVGCFELARRIASGLGMAKDETRAIVLFEDACTLGEMRACTVLAQMREVGLGVPADATIARELFEKACNGGDPSACPRSSSSAPQPAPGGSTQRKKAVKPTWSL